MIPTPLPRYAKDAGLITSTMFILHIRSQGMIVPKTC